MGDDNIKQIDIVLRNMVGKWIFDIDFVRESLRNGAKMQELWCGYGWPESEISKREQFIRTMHARKGPIVTHVFSHIGSGSLKIQMENSDDNETKINVLSECKQRDTNTYTCKQTRGSDKEFVFRRDGEFIYYMIKMTPDMMNCKIKSTSPSEFWYTSSRMKKSKI